MADRVLPESEVEDLEDLIQAFGKLFPAEAKKLIASHRLLQRRVTELEDLNLNWEQAFAELDTP
ncbi:hypothetical protein LCGC14_1470900 [marine sediment metagenome]|uniref:Uncharacterized protein n=1 Tax=marine sediment metagenome TaxID=412755 RepID=A0A0F9JYC6_9ZZZZ